MSRFRPRPTVILGTELLVAVCCLSFFLPIPRSRLKPGGVVSLRLEDRNGLRLREVRSGEGGRCRWVGWREISPLLIKATVAAEDRHFFAHPGVNLYAVARAVLQNIRRRQVISGASTITQQVIRNIYHFRRSLINKALEAWLAVRLEHTLSKDEILVQYLNRVSYGNQTYGVEAAARLYFDKPASDLGLAESAFLAGLPRAPSDLNPYRNLKAAVKNQEDILGRMARLEMISSEDRTRAVHEPLMVRPEKEKFRAPHFCDFVLARLMEQERQGISVIRTTLDLALQDKVELQLRRQVVALAKKGISNGAVLVLDNKTGDILAMAGSADFFDSVHDGQVNGVTALRQPGSTLKPLTYALALEHGMTAATILDDVPSEFATLEGNFAPENYDEKYHGPIRLRSALASSYNIPAVAVLQTLGPDLLYDRLHELGFSSLQKSPQFYGVGLTLGNGEVTLLELVRAYATLARGGSLVRDRSLLRFVMKDGRVVEVAPAPGPQNVFSLEASYIITHILEDRDARIPTFGYNSPLDLPFPTAAKTGTSKDFRDNWTVGYTPRYTVGVWVGNFDGRPMQNVSGITGAGPLFRDVMLLLDDGRKESFAVPPDIVHAAICPLSGERPSQNCPSTIDEVFLRGTEPTAICRLPHTAPHTLSQVSTASSSRTNEGFAVAFPKEGDVFKIDPVLRSDFQALRFKAALPEGLETRALEWWLNGQKLDHPQSSSTYVWKLAPGSYTIKARVVLATGSLETRPVRFTVIF
jgi:penicillin-binding protein 1C